MMDIVGYGAFFLTTALIFALITLGLNLQWGMTGLFNVGLAGFVAIGAYTSALLTTPDTIGRFGGFDMPIVIGWLGAMIVTGIAAAITGIATLRLKSDYLAITTFGVAVVVQLVALNAQKTDRRPLRHRLYSASFRQLGGNACVVQLLQPRRRRRCDAGRLPGPGAFGPQPLGSGAESIA